MQTVLSPVGKKGDTIEKLLKIPVDKVKEKLYDTNSDERLRYLGALLEGNGWIVSYHLRGNHADTLLLSYPKEPDNIVLLLRLDASRQELTYEDARIHLRYFEGELAPRYQCRQFCLVTFNGYESKAEQLEDFNLLLQKWNYVEELHHDYSPGKVREPRIQLFAHNKQTYKKVQRLMQQTNAVAVVQATGTGKSYLIAKLLQDFHGANRLVMAPSSFIIEQIKEHIRWEADKIQFMTYAKGMNLSESEIKALQPGMIALDEFHRCGAEEWGRGVQNILNAYPNAFKFGTSATPIRYLDNARDMSKELFSGHVAENLSLAQAISRSILPMPKYVCAIYTLKEEADNLRELVKKSRKNEEAKRQILSELDTLSLDWERSNGIPQVLKKHWRKHMCKFIVFCENEKHLLEMEPIVVGWFKEATENLTIKTHRIYIGEENSDENLEAFKNSKEKDTVHLLFSINMLNEGLHVNEVSGVVLLRPTESPNIFYQQIGRCLKVGMNYTPVIFDFVNNFKTVRSHDFMYDLQEARRFYASSRKEQDLKDLCPEFTIIDEVREITEVFGEIQFKVEDWEAMFDRLVNFKKEFGHCNVRPDRGEDKRLGWWLYWQKRKYREGLLEKERVDRLVSLGAELRLDLHDIMRDNLWMKHFEELCEFREIYGHCNVHESFKKDKKIGHLNAFVRKQRTRYAKGTLQEYRIKKLESIGFEWDRREFIEGQWQKGFDELVAFKNKHGHCIVTTKKNSSLAKFVEYQRDSLRMGRLDPLRKQKLDSLGFEWNLRDKGDVLFEKRFAEMIAFKEQQHHLVFNKGNLASYAHKLRKQYKQGNLSDDKIKRLESIGFRFEILELHSAKKENKLIELKRFYDKHGHGNPTHQHTDFPGLSDWVNTQRKQYRKGILSSGLIRRLEELKVDWNRQPGVDEIAWEEKYQALLKYYEEHGTLLGISKQPQYRKLNQWCIYLRGQNRKEKLTPQQMEKLNLLNFNWEVLDERWDERFAELVAFKEKYGHTRVPGQSKEYKLLGTWRSNVRSYYKKGTLSKERIKRLEGIGFEWDVNEEDWQNNYESLKQLLQQHGWKDLYSKSKKLNTWVLNNRKLYHKGKLPENKIMLLNQLGIEWSPIKQKWDSMYEQLLKYKEKHGKSHVSTVDTELRQLGIWCSNQRQNYKRNILAPEQIKLLNDIEFPWEVKVGDNIHQDQWEEMYQQLLEYREQHGHSHVYIVEPQYKKLSAWCNLQRINYKKNKLTPSRMQLLNDIKFPWSISKTRHPQYDRHFNKSYPLLVKYYKQTGKSWVEPNDAVKNSELKSLYSWCSYQRNAYWENKLKPEQVKLLEDIDFPFERRKPKTTRA